jgi:Transaldolase/Fructose-6-phosphate aldolase/Pyridoxal-dependent decarboxylase conserved domain
VGVLGSVTLLAYDTASTRAAAKDLYARAGRPNLLIKIPGTNEGLPAIEEAIFAGIPINVTLLFSREQYVSAAEAFLRGIERRLEAGLKPGVGSVASVFISRWDAAVAGKVPEALRNQLGIAIAKRTYKAARALHKLSSLASHLQRRGPPATPLMGQRGRLSCCGRADSITLDPHKLLFAPLEAGSLIVQNSDKLRDTFHFSSSYLSVEPDSLMMNFLEYGPQLSRGFKAFKIWCSLQAFGVHPFRSAAQRMLEISEYMAARVRAERAMELLAPGPLTAVCFAFRNGASTHTILAKLNGRRYRDSGPGAHQWA